MELFKISEDLPEKNEYGVYGLDIGTNKVENQITIWIGGGEKHPSNKEEEQAKLIVDCLNTYEYKKLKPSELLEQRDELLDVLERSRKWMINKGIDVESTLFESIEKVLKQIGYERT